MTKRITILTPVKAAGGTDMTVAGSPYTIADELAAELVNRGVAAYTDAQVPPSAYGAFVTYMTAAQFAQLAAGVFGVIYEITDTGGRPQYRWNGAAFVTVGGGGGSGDMVAANNLSDVANAATARGNLGALAAAAPSSTGIQTSTGASVTTAAAMGALAVDVTKGLNTKSVAADSTLTFSGTPAAADTWFALHLTNTDTAPHIITMPSAFSQATQAARTTFPLAASGQVYLLWRYDGTAYKVFGDPGYLNNFAASVAPAVTDDVAKGYGPGSLWYDATANKLYINESNGAGAAIWSVAGAAPLQTFGISFAIDTVANGDYTIVLRMPFAGTITETASQCTSGTATATFKVGTTALGGTANAVSSSLQTQAQASSNTFAANDLVKVTMSSNSSCVGAVFGIKYTRTLA